MKFPTQSINDKAVSIKKIIVTSGRKIFFIDMDKIKYVEACNYYCLIHEGDRTFVVRQSLNDLEKKLDGQTFLRIHRSFILNINIFTCIEKVNNTMLVHTTIGKDFTVSRYRRKTLHAKFLQ